MSNTLAIAAVTSTLRRLIEEKVREDLPGAEVTTSPPDVLGDTNGQNRVNLFLYHTDLSSHWRNSPGPRHTKPGESGHPPLALDLYYLISAYGKDDDDVKSHRLLGRAMRTLHDFPILSPEEIVKATSGDLPDSDLHEQIESVRITPEALTVDDMSKLWNTFQTQYRISAAYRASIVLIDSQRRARTPLPVLKRGEGDLGWDAQPDLLPPFPILESVEPPNEQPGVRLAETLTLQGHHLEGDQVEVYFSNPRWDAPVMVTPDSFSTREVQVQIPDAPAVWPAGVYTVSVLIKRTGEQDRETNEIPFSIAPQIINIDPNPASRDGDNNVSLEITCKPEIQPRDTDPTNLQPEQRAALLLGDREIMSEPHPTQTDTLTFQVTDISPGEYFLRLRVDGVDSLLVVDRTAAPPVFDSTQKVVIT